MGWTLVWRGEVLKHKQTPHIKSPNKFTFQMDTELWTDNHHRLFLFHFVAEHECQCRSGLFLSHPWSPAALVLTQDPAIEGLWSVSSPARLAH